MVKIGLIGYGYWGVNLLRNLIEVSSCSVEVVCDKRQERSEAVNENYPEIDVTLQDDDVFANSSIDAIVIATPINSHYSLTKKALLSGKHVLVEKPLSTSLAEAEELVQIANSQGLILAVDHTFLYSEPVQKIKQLVEEDELGELQYIDSTRVNLGKFQTNASVVWDLASHDISIINYLTNTKPTSVICSGVAHTELGIQNIAFLNLIYDNDFIAHVNCSWISPVKIRKVLIGGSKKMCLYDDLESDKVKVFDSGYYVETDNESSEKSIKYKTGEVFLPSYSDNEALNNLVVDFVGAIQENRKPLVSAEEAIEVVKILVAAETSMNNGGKEILISEIEWSH